ncbi:MAG: NTP transferase domain-containing protein [Elusimicrobia bacterium]|nr:NTP transferase domain-containing protein [Elusimicrobiota bacterium]
MKAMVLAAGLGTRLRPLTDAAPKCLIEVGGMPLLELALRRLRAAGVLDAVVNAHHHADQVAAFVGSLGPRLGMRLELSRENPVLETGGGLMRAADFFDDERPFFVYNSDVVTDLDLKALMAAQQASRALATLAVLDRPSSRKLLFKEGRLVGRAGGPAAPGTEALAFSGVHACSPEFLGRVIEDGVFSLTDVWLRLAAEGALIAPFRHDGGLWADVGDAEKLENARRLGAGRGLPI